MAELDDYFFTFDGANHPDGPWRHFRVVELRGEEAISRPFWFEVDAIADSPDTSVRELIGHPAALKIRTDTEPSFRIIHGLITGAVELPMRDATSVGRYRITMQPPSHRTALMKRSCIFLDKTLREIVDSVLKRQKLGAGLVPSTAARPLMATEDLDRYVAPRLTYAWALHDTRRVDDPEAHPYCVQYDETDHDFVARLLEEEGVSFHYEHSDDECCLVLTDFDGGRPEAPQSVGPNVRAREVFAFSDGARLRPRSVFMSDYDWRKPSLDLGVTSPGGATEFTDVLDPGRYRSDAMGEVLAEKREQRLDTERSYATAEGHCRALTAGNLVKLEHDAERFSGTYLITELRHHGVQRDRVTRSSDEHYRQQLELMRGAPFRPARATARPRIYGTQTAVVTADPSDPEAEIHVGGPHNLGCIRVRFHWDRDGDRHAKEPTSCWVRVSQFFAGRDHGALWHPRVGDEVVVEYLDGDPDRPIVVGRVYNGTHPAPENATQCPTYSAIKSNTSPYDGNYNLIAFEDLQGSEEIIIHAARDYNSNVERNQSVNIGLHNNITVTGNQIIHVKGMRTVNVDASQDFHIGINHTLEAGALIFNKAPSIVMSDDVFIQNSVAFTVMHSGAETDIQSSGIARLRAPVVRIEGVSVSVKGAFTLVQGSDELTLTGATVIISGGTVNIGAEGDINVNASGNVNVTGGSVNLNC